MKRTAGFSVEIFYKIDHLDKIQQFGSSVAMLKCQSAKLNLRWDWFFFVVLLDLSEDVLCAVNFSCLSNTYFSIWSDQSHYREVLRWESFMEQELRLGLDFSHWHCWKNNIWADYEQLFRPFFSSFCGQKNENKNMVASPLKCCLKWC